MPTMSTAKWFSGEKPVLIAGGGIGGLAAALALGRKGAAVHVLEQAATFGEIGAGIQLGPNVFQMFDALGVTAAINHMAVFPDALVMRDGVTGDEVTRIPLGTAFRKRFGNPYGVIHRGDLHQVLLDACRQLPRITLSVGQKVAGYAASGDGVSVELADGGHIAGCALIGADGLWSAIRAQLVGDGKPRVSGHIAYRAVLPMAEVPEHLRWNTVVLWAGPKTHLVQYPLRRGELFNLVAVFHSSRYEEGWNAYGDPDELHERFSAARPEVKLLLSKINAWKMWVLCDREPIRDWSLGPVTLLGDAAHPMLQYLAQGANMALEDAVTLADLVERAQGDFAAAFQAYQQARYLRTARVQLTARFYGDIYHAAGATRDLRNSLLHGRDPQKAYEGMAWLYDGIA
jgi:2-polyprenyl-6-methoxyphenol hydroxylase-like FAD-dependent oxidoreductase